MNRTEDEVGAILAAAVKPETCVRLGVAPAALGHKISLTNADVELLQQVKDQAPAKLLRLK